jgi:hypothetical protein
MPKPKPHASYDLSRPEHYCPGAEYGVEDPDATTLWPDDWSFDRAAQSRPPICRFCGERMERVTLGNTLTSNHPRFDADWDQSREYHLLNCPHCCHWRFKACEAMAGCMTPVGLINARSVARTFDTPIPDGCAAEVAQQLRRDPTFWHNMPPRDMERFVADIFRANYRCAEVVHVGKPGDLGIDVLFVDAGGNDWLVQVKRRERPGAVEGFDSLQRLLGTLALEGKVRGIIVTTAGRFSRPLFKQRARAEQRGFKIHLLDRGKLDRMLSPVLPVRPWLGLMGAGVLSLFDDEVRRHFIANTSDPRQLRLF